MRIHLSILIFGAALPLLLLGFGCAPAAPAPKPIGSNTSTGTIYCTQDVMQCPDGSYVGRTWPNCEFRECSAPSSTTVNNTCDGSRDLDCDPGYVCIQKCGPPVAREDDPAPGYYCELTELAGKPRMCPICLASNTNIGTPTGPINVTKITVGSKVWSLNERGETVAATVIKTVRTPVPKTHQVIHLVLTDKREIWVSPNHPAVTGQLVGSMRIGDIYDGSRVAQIDLIPYWDDATYDILPDSPTGAYLANGIWLGSTLSR